MKNVRKIVAGSLMLLSLASATIPVPTHAGIFFDGVTSSHTSVQSDTKGYYAYGYVKMKKSHTTTSQLKLNNVVIKTKISVQDTGKVTAETGRSKKAETGRICGK